MTGFARETGLVGTQSWVWELKSVNARGLDVRLRVPPGYDAIGDEARKRILGAFSRGTINANLTVTSEGSVARPRINGEAMRALLASLAAIDLPDGIGPLTYDGLLRAPGVIEMTEDAGPAPDVLHGAILSGLDHVVAGLRQARLGEGRALANVLGGQMEAIAALAGQAEIHPARTPEAIRTRLAEQVTLLMNATNGLDPARLHQEAAILVVKADIREEIDRLKAHLDQLRGLLAAGGSMGRKLDFLAQEFGREASTLSAKAGDVALSKIGLELRTVVDQLREQVQNVE